MYTEAFLFLANIVQKPFMKSILLGKDNFTVELFNGEQLNYSYDEKGIIDFLEMYEAQES